MAGEVSGAEILIQTLQQEGVDVVFGHPGGVVLPLYDKLHSAALQHVLMRHEQAAAHAADGYSRATGRVGVCLATSGPGATNLVTGIAAAYMDSIPMLVLTGQVPRRAIGTDAFQEADVIGITRPCSKHSYLVTDVDELSSIIHEAYFIAGDGRPGPVVVDIPKDVFLAKTVPAAPQDLRRRQVGFRKAVDPRSISEAARLIRESCRPIIYAGGGIINAGASAELAALAEETRTPVTTTLMGMGSIPTEHPCNLGMLGMHGTYYANMAISNADLLVALGVRFDDRVTGKLEAFARHAQIIHVDVDPAEIHKNVRVDVPIVGNVAQVLPQLRAALTEDPDALRRTAESHETWWSQIYKWKEEVPLRFEAHEREVKPQAVIAEVSRLCPPDAIIATDVGQHQMWAAQFYNFHMPRTWLTSGGLGSMGYGLPAALGAQVAYPKRLVVAIVGDGGFQMTMQELATLVEFKLPVKIVIINNGYLGMVRQWQEFFYEKRYASSDIRVAPDFVKLGEAFGIPSMRIDRPDQLRASLQWAFDLAEPALLDCQVAQEENVFPMVPPGGAIDEMILGPQPLVEDANAHA